MTSSLSLFARMFVIGIAVAAPVGAMGVLCIHRTLAGGWSRGMATGLGIATADGIYAGLAAFGVSAIAASLVAWQTPLRLVGGLILIVLGIRAALAAPIDPEDRSRPTAPSNPGRAYASAVGLTLTNPTTIMAFGAIFASAGLAAQPTPASAAIATLGVFLGSLCWWTFLATTVTYARSRIDERWLRSVNRVSGGIVAGFGVLAIASVLTA